MTTVIKIIIIIKEKEGKRQGKKTRVRRDSNLGLLSQHYGFTTRPRGLSHLELACSAGVLFCSGARIFFLPKRMLKLEKRGENGASQKERGGVGRGAGGREKR